MESASANEVEGEVTEKEECEVWVGEEWMEGDWEFDVFLEELLIRSFGKTRLVNILSDCELDGVETNKTTITEVVHVLSILRHFC